MKAKRFYETEEEFHDFHVMLKLVLCPHCLMSGYLILNGILYGFSDMDTDTIKKGHRIFCSNRNNRNGCGRTFSVLLSGVIKNFMISGTTLWCFLNNLINELSLKAAFKKTGSPMHETGPLRLFKRFKLNQVHIRSLLSRVKDPPALETVHDPAFQTIYHLKHVFDQDPCPISRFQHYFQKSFL